jgi:hypothetical protein
MPVIQVQVNSPSALASLSANTNPSVLGGRAAELIVAELHSPLYTAAYNGFVNWVTTATGGTTIPVQAASLASTFTVWNPLGSGKNLELIGYSAAFVTATTVVSDVSLYFQTGVGGGSVAVPTNLTALTIRNGLLGGGIASVASAYSVATLVGAIVKGPTLFAPTTTQSVAGGSTGPSLFNYQFRGEIIVPPGTLVTTAGNAAQSSAATQTLYWAEWPI